MSAIQELINAIEGVQDWKGTHVGDCIAAVEAEQFADTSNLRSRLADAQARAERAEGVLEAIREHCQSRHDFARAALIEAGNEQDRGHYRGQRDSLGLVLDKLDRALTPAPQGLTDKQLTGELLINTNDKTIQWILGLPCFFCAPIAHILVKNGHSIEAKAEAEQAYVIPWLIRKYHEHGKCEEWKAKVDAELNAIKRKHMDATAPEVKGGAA